MSVMQNDIVYKRFVQIVDDVFSTMVGMEVEGVLVKPDERKLLRNEISAMMMLIGERNVMVSLSMTYDNAKLIIAYMTGISAEELKQSDVCDGVAEIVNIIAGKGKAIFKGTEHYYQLSSPFTIIGEQLFVNYKNKSLQWISKFSSSEIEMYLEFVYI